MGYSELERKKITVGPHQFMLHIHSTKPLLPSVIDFERTIELGYFDKLDEILYSKQRIVLCFPSKVHRLFFIKFILLKERPSLNPHLIAAKYFNFVKKVGALYKYSQ